MIEQNGGHEVVWGNQTFDRFKVWRGGATWVKHHAQQETCMGQNGMAEFPIKKRKKPCKWFRDLLRA